MSTHLLIGGSTVGRILNCPGSAKLAAKAPRTTSAPAERGTRLHEAATAVIQHAVPVETALRQVRHDTPGDASYVLKARAAIERLLGYRKGKRPPRVVEVHHERMVKMSANAGGTADFLAATVSHAFVADFKFGTRPVAVKDNPQLLLYAASAKAEIPAFNRVRSFRLAIIQPALVPVLTTHEVTRGAVTKFADRVQLAEALALLPEPPLKVGEWCGYCPAKGICPKLRATGGTLAESLAKLAFKV